MSAGSAAVRTPNSPGLRRGIAAWLTRHLQVFFSTAGQLTRNPLATLMTVGVIGIALALPAGLYVLLDNFQQLSQAWQGNSQMSLFLEPGISDDRARQIADRLKKRDDIQSVTIITRSQALQEFEEISGFAEAFAALEENPLPAVLLVQPTAAAAEGLGSQRLIQALDAEPDIDIAQFDMQWTRRLFAIMAVIERGVIVMAGLLAMAVLLIIGNTIGLGIQSRREEIEITRLFGASNAFIRRPFLYNGAWYGLLGALFGWLLVSLSFWLVSTPVAELAALYRSQFQLRGLGVDAVLLLLGTGTGLGWLGSRFAVGRHLRDLEAAQEM